MGIRKILLLVCFGMFCSFSSADVANPEQQSLVSEVTSQTKEQEAKQCLKELEQETDKAENADTDSKQEPSWFEKTFNYHKLGSLHFQDIIELFH